MVASDNGTTEMQVVTAQQRGETIAYALQGCVYNLAANLFEPYINYRVQKHYGKDAQHGSYGQNLGGEIAGDISGAGALILAETFMPNQFHCFMRDAGRWVDPIYERAAHVALAKEKDSPDYQQKVDNWKAFQEKNLVRSAIMLTAGISGNLAAQKLLFGNPSPTSLIFKGKLLSLSITTAIGLVSRLAFPEQMKALDRKIGEKFAPVMKDKEIPALPPEDGVESHVARLALQNAEVTAPAR